MINKFFISFSGGETSGYMTHKLLEFFKKINAEVVVLFANTGQEHEETLKFVDRCDKQLGFNTVWLEANVFKNERKGTSYNIVDFENANRMGVPFESVIQKYGIPNKAYPHCTRELKLQPMMSYIKNLGWKNGEYKTCIGIRYDEMQRVSRDAIDNKNIIYPLVNWKVTKDDVREFWSKQSFRLNIHEHYGNCKWCWKKSNRKLYTLINEDASIFNFPMEMEKNYEFSGNGTDKTKGRVFFRGNVSTKQLIENSKQQFEPFTDKYRVSLQNYDEELDSAGGCSESCDIFSI